MMEFMLMLSVFIFIQSSHPISMGILICISSIPVILIMGHSLGNFWFSYLSFLVLLGAILVLFMYVSSLVSNEIFSFMTINVGFVALLFFILIILNQFNTNFSSSFMINIGEFYNETYYELMLFLISYLLISLLIIVSLVQLFKGPLREMI